jgi:hypothetical protein
VNCIRLLDGFSYKRPEWPHLGWCAVMCRQHSYVRITWNPVGSEIVSSIPLRPAIARPLRPGLQH